MHLPLDPSGNYNQPRLRVFLLKEIKWLLFSPFVCPGIFFKKEKSLILLFWTSWFLTTNTSGSGQTGGLSPHGLPRSRRTQTAEDISQNHRPLGGLPETYRGALTPIQHLTVPLIKRARLTCLSAATPHRLPRCMCVSESSGLLHSTTNPVNNYQHRRTPGSS